MTSEILIFHLSSPDSHASAHLHKLASRPRRPFLKHLLIPPLHPPKPTSRIAPLWKPSLNCQALLSFLMPRCYFWILKVSHLERQPQCLNPCGIPSSGPGTSQCGGNAGPFDPRPHLKPGAPQTPFMVTCWTFEQSLWLCPLAFKSC